MILPRRCLTLLTLAATASIGCGPADRGYVRGTVTLDGKPLPEATVEFQPEQGSPSFGETDGSGVYELALSATEKGAVLGSHTIRVSTYRVVPQEDGTRKVIPEQVPSSFNDASTVIREVTPGRQTIDIEITANG